MSVSITDVQTEHRTTELPSAFLVLLASEHAHYAKTLSHHSTFLPTATTAVRDVVSVRSALPAEKSRDLVIFEGLDGKINHFSVRVRSVGISKQSGTCVVVQKLLLQVSPFIAFFESTF